MLFMGHDFKATAQAYLKFSQVLDDLEKCKKLFEFAGEPLPEQLKEFMGVSRSFGRKTETLVTISPPPRHSRPTEANNEWISVKVEDASATGLVLAVLRQASGPTKAKDMTEQVAQLNPLIPRGSVHNIGTRLDGTLISRSDAGWSLIDPKKAGILHGGFLWGPKDVFDKTEIAAHRREAILTILKGFPSGLQTVQIVEQLRGRDWVQAPASKDLVKSDMELLEAYNKVRRMGNSRKWCIRED
jgi:hypothetical protein